MSLRLAMVAACAYPVPQGSQMHLRETALALQRRGHAVRLVVYGYGLGETEDSLPIHRTRRWPGDARTGAGPYPLKLLLDAGMVRTLRRVCREHRIDVVHAHNYEALLIALAARCRPIVYHPHNALADELPYYTRYKTAARQFGRWLDHGVPRFADRVIAMHRRLAGHLIIRGCDHRKVRVVPPAIDTSPFTACTVGSEIPPVLYTGNLDAYQNVGLLRAAMDEVRKSLPEARLRIATGDQKTIAQAEMVATPDTAALRAVLAEDAVLAVPRVSWSGYPMKLLNAMAAGLAIVACESAAYPLVHRESGLIVPDNQPQAFAAALLELMRDPRLRAELGKNARAKVQRENAPELVAARLEEIDEELLRARGARRSSPTENRASVGN